MTTGYSGTSLVRFKVAMKKVGAMWGSWPRDSSAIATDLVRESIREYILKIPLVDIKVTTIDEDWSRLKFVYRLKHRE